MAAAKTGTDTIAAVSTPPGRGGIGIVRLKRTEATSIAEQLVRLRQPWNLRAPGWPMCWTTWTPK